MPKTPCPGEAYVTKLSFFFDWYAASDHDLCGTVASCLRFCNRFANAIDVSCPVHILNRGPDGSVE